MELANLHWLKHKELDDEWGGMRLHHATAERSFDCADAIGVDPGRNWGIGIITNGMVSVWWGKMIAQQYDYDYFQYAKQFITEWFPKKHPAKKVLVEGPSYGSPYKQPMLEDVRLGFLQGFIELGKEVEYIPPQTVRKGVFGNGRTKASNLWLGIAPDAADAAAIALYSGNYKP